MKKFVRKIYEYLCREYNAFMLVDLKQDYVEGYLSAGDNAEGRRVTNSYTGQIRQIADHLQPEYVKEWLKLSSIEHVKKLLETEDHVEIEYQLNDEEKHWQKVTLQVVEREEGVATQLIMAHIPLDSIHIEKLELNKQLELQKKQLEESLNRERQYHKAILEGATAIYEINLTKDILYRASGFYQGEEMSLAKRVELESPCSYSLYVERVANMIKDEKKRKDYLKASLAEHLLRCFYQKERFRDEVYPTRDVMGNRQYLKKTYILSQNENTGDIHALIIAKNVTVQQQREMLNREIIDGVSTEFSSIYIRDWKTDEIRLFKTNGNYPTLLGLQNGVEPAERAMGRYADVAVHPEDKERFLQECDGQNLREALMQHNIVDINFRRIIEGEMDYAQIHCVRVDNNAGTPNIVMAFRSVDEIVRREHAYEAEKERLTRQSRIDGLSGLLNKVTFQRETTEYLEENSALNSAFIFIDVDHFKQINDRLGHSMGDVLIKDVSQKIQVIFANCDLIGRFGGDEFCAYVKNIPINTLEARLAWAQKKLAGEYAKGDEKINVTVSIGCAYCTIEKAHYEPLLDLADEALYEAKENGRNQYKLVLYK